MASQVPGHLDSKLLLRSHKILEAMIFIQKLRWYGLIVHEILKDVNELCWSLLVGYIWALRTYYFRYAHHTTPCLADCFNGSCFVVSSPILKAPLYGHVCFPIPYVYPGVFGVLVYSNMTGDGVVGWLSLPSTVPGIDNPYFCWWCFVLNTVHSATLQRTTLQWQIPMLRSFSEKSHW